MELNCNRQAVTINEVLFDACVEQSVESDIVLADYCPDIVKILKCQVQVKINSTQVAGEKLTVDGMACVKVYYCTEDSTARCHRFKIPYVKVCDLKGPGKNCVVDINAKVDYVNCRAISSRRLEVRGAISHNICVTCCREEEIICDAYEMGVQLKKDISTINQLTGEGVRQFAIREELELEYGRPSIGILVDARAHAVVTDYKAIGGKVVTKGELHLEMSYYCTEEKKDLERLEYTVPISQIVDCEGVSEESLCHVNFDVITLEVEPKSDLDGETRRMGIEALVNCTIHSHMATQLINVSDCYSTLYECGCVCKTVSVLHVAQQVEEVHTFKQCTDLPDDTRGIADIWCEVVETNTKVDQDCLCCTVKLNICMLAYDNNDCIDFFDRTEEFTHKIAIPHGCHHPQFSPVVQPIATTYSMTGTEKLEIRCEVSIKGCIYCAMEKRLVSRIDMNTDKHKCCKNNCALTIYYADKGESVWEIAKRYNTVVEGVMEENNLQEDVLDSRRMLLIPMV